MQLTTRLAQSARPLSGSDAARQKINRALELLQEAKAENSELTDIYEAAGEALLGPDDHIKAIEFDRPSKDVSAHGTALREQADGADGIVHQADDEVAVVNSHTATMLSLVDGAKADLGDSNRTATWRLNSAWNDLNFVSESNLPGINRAVDYTSRLLKEDLDPYLTEVEEDEPGRDVGRFADDIEEIWNTARGEVRSGPIYVRSAGRNFVSAEAFLNKALEAL